MAWARKSRPRVSLFKNKPSQSFDGRSFSSGLERAVYEALTLRKYSGEIAGIECQVTISICGPLGHECGHKCKIEYISDFRCTAKDGSIFYVEAKGFANEKWPLKLRLYRHYGPAPLELWGGTKARPHLIELVIPKNLV